MLRLAAAPDTVLSALGAGPGPHGLDDRQRAPLASAISDAITHRDPSGFCAACGDEGLCDDLDKTDAYIQLRREVRIEAGE